MAVLDHLHSFFFLASDPGTKGLKDSHGFKQKLNELSGELDPPQRQKGVKPHMTSEAEHGILGLLRPLATCELGTDTFLKSRSQGSLRQCTLHCRILTFKTHNYVL